MIDTKKFVDQLIAGGIHRIAGVPCSFLGPLINEAENRGMYEPFVNEGDALAYAAGAALAGRRCAVAMQSSGLSNALSPLTAGEPAARYRNVTACSRVQVASGLKV